MCDVLSFWTSAVRPHGFRMLLHVRRQSHMSEHMVPMLVDVCTDVSWLNWNCLSPVLLSLMHINEPTCFVLACFQVPSLAPDCFLSRHEASERFAGSFPGGVSLSELYLPVINVVRRSRLYDRQETKQNTFLHFSWKMHCLCSVFRLNMNFC